MQLSLGFIGQTSLELNGVVEGSDTIFPPLPVELVSEFWPEGVNWRRMTPFWEAYRPWLAARGISLHELRKGGSYPHVMWPPANSTHSELPYARRRANDVVTLEPLEPGNAKVLRAQDAQGRDVVIKLANPGTDEYDIYQHLLHSKDLFGRDWQGVLPPTAILDTEHSFSFIVMPTWGPRPEISKMETVSQVLTFMHCMLKGLAFLHKSGIVHRDIDDYNIMINFYSLSNYERAGSFYETLREYKRSAEVQYCLFDFNASLKFPAGTSVRDCRIPSSGMCVSGSGYRPDDALFGEPQYNPFAYDVACVGNLFRAQFLETITVIPLLAPLFDKMTTHVQSERFSACEALSFFENLILSEVTQETLRQEIKQVFSWEPLDADTNLYWPRLPPEFSARWARYRTPSRTAIERAFILVVSYKWGGEVVDYIRQVLRR